MCVKENTDFRLLPFRQAPQAERSLAPQWPPSLVTDERTPQVATLLFENGVLTRALARAQSSTQEMAQAHARTQARLEQEAVRLRGELIIRQTEIDQLQQELGELRAASSSGTTQPRTPGAI